MHTRQNIMFHSKWTALQFCSIAEQRWIDIQCMQGKLRITTKINITCGFVGYRQTLYKNFFQEYQKPSQV